MEKLFYVMTFPQARKVSNLKQALRISVTIDHDVSDWNRITGLSMAAHPEFVTDAKEIRRVEELMLTKFPQVADWPEPDPTEITIVKLKPRVISIPGYRKGFSQADLVEL